MMMMTLNFSIIVSYRKCWCCKWLVQQSAGKRVWSRLLRTSPVRARLLFRPRGSYRGSGRASDAWRGRADQLRPVVSAGPLCSPRRDWLDCAEDSVTPKQRRRRSRVRETQVRVSTVWRPLVVHVLRTQVRLDRTSPVASGARSMNKEQRAETAEFSSASDSRRLPTGSHHSKCFENGEFFLSKK